MSKITIDKIEGDGIVVGDNNNVSNSFNASENLDNKPVDLTKEILKFLLEHNTGQFVNIGPHLARIWPNDAKAISSTISQLLYTTGLRHDNLIDEDHSYDDWRQLGNPYKKITIGEATIRLRINRNGISFYNQNYRDSITKHMNTTFNTTGDGNVIVAGNENKIDNNVTLYKGNLEKLNKELLAHGLTEDDVKELNDIIDNEEPDLKTKEFANPVNNWIRKMVVKTMDGTWHMATHTAAILLAEAISRYYGFK